MSMSLIWWKPAVNVIKLPRLLEVPQAISQPLTHPHIGLWREIWWTAEVELAHLQRTWEGLMACDCVRSHINSNGCHKLQQSVWACWGKTSLSEKQSVYQSWDVWKCPKQQISSEQMEMMEFVEDRLGFIFKILWWISTKCSSDVSTHISGSKITWHRCYFDMVEPPETGWKSLKHIQLPQSEIANMFYRPHKASVNPSACVLAAS